MKVEFTDFAWNEITNIANYICLEFGENSMNKFMDDIYHTASLLATNPFIGPIEPSLVHLPTEIHSIVVARKNKAIYFIESKDVVKIVDFWDCRRNPIALVERATDWE